MLANESSEGKPKVILFLNYLDTDYALARVFFID